jgi:ADP-ribose pyrophosphatase YjhB (NUDIX family)
MMGQPSGEMRGLDSIGETDVATVALRLAQIADQIRAMANNGLHYGKDPYDIDRYQRLLKLAAELLSMATTQPLDELARIFVDDVQMRTPLSGVDTATFDEAGRVLLIRRADNHKWAMPGGACEVGDLPAENAAREVWEETGYAVQITHFLGIFDNFRHRQQDRGRHGYLLLFAAEVTGGTATVSNETLAVRWFAQAEIPWAELSPGHVERLHHALRWYHNHTTPAYFDPIQ